MSQTAEKFASIDNQLAEAKAAWNVERQTLLDRIMFLEGEVKMYREGGIEAVHARIEAEQRSAKLQSLFAVVRFTLAEAEKLDSNPPPTKPPSEGASGAARLKPPQPSPDTIERLNAAITEAAAKPEQK